MKYVSLEGHIGEAHHTSLAIHPHGVFEVVGVLTHGYHFKPTTCEDAMTIAYHMMQACQPLDVEVSPWPPRMELGKRTPLPDITCKCGHCDHLVTLTGLTTDYPKVNEPHTVGTLCPDCDEEIVLTINVAVMVQVLKQE